MPQKGGISVIGSYSERPRHPGTPFSTWILPMGGFSEVGILPACLSLIHTPTTAIPSHCSILLSTTMLYSDFMLLLNQLQAIPVLKERPKTKMRMIMILKILIAHASVICKRWRFSDSLCVNMLRS